MLVKKLPDSDKKSLYESSGGGRWLLNLPRLLNSLPNAPAAALGLLRTGPIR